MTPDMVEVIRQDIAKLLQKVAQLESPPPPPEEIFEIGDVVYYKNTKHPMNNPAICRGRITEIHTTTTEHGTGAPTASGVIPMACSFLRRLTRNCGTSSRAFCLLSLPSGG